MFIKVIGKCVSHDVTSKAQPVEVKSNIDRSVTNWGEAGVCWRPARPTTAYQGFPNNRHNPVMVYNDLMIRYISVHNYNKDRSQPVTIQCINTWVGAPVDRRQLTGMICPNRALISVRIIVPFFCMASNPLSTSHQLILVIYIVYLHLSPRWNTPN